MDWVQNEKIAFQSAQVRYRDQILDTMVAMVQSSLRAQLGESAIPNPNELLEKVRSAAEEAFLSAEQQGQAVNNNLGAQGAQVKDAGYWVQWMLGNGLKLAAAAVVIGLAGVGGKYYSENKSMSAASHFVAEQMEKNKKIPFEPETIQKFHQSYTDNVLYTKDYTKLEIEGKSRDAWNVRLNRWALRSLDMSNEAVVNFLAKEVALTKKLAQMKDDIDGKNPEKGIEKMRAFEKKYLPRLEKILGGPEQFEKFFAFKRQQFEARWQQ